MRAANALADGLRYQNLGRLRLANVVELRGALDVMLKGQEQRGSSADAFATFLAKSPHAAAALQCCSLDARVLADNPHKAELSMEWLAAELARIKRRTRTPSAPASSTETKELLLHLLHSWSVLRTASAPLSAALGQQRE